MRIGVDISQIVHEGTGVGEYVRKLVSALIKIDQNNEYVLFGASLRKRHVFHEYFNTVKSLSNKVKLVVLPIPPPLLEFLWNVLHVVPVEWLIGPVHVFYCSDWTQPPLARARGVTTIHDVSFLRYPETFAKTIINVQKRRLRWVARECTAILCDSEATRADVIRFLDLERSRLHVVYPGYS